MSKRGKFNFAERVRAGAALLDARKPGWDSKIKADRLALEDGSACVLGQVYGDYSDGYRELFALEENSYNPEIEKTSEALGFVLTGTASRQYRRLTQAWKRFLSKRRGNSG